LKELNRPEWGLPLPHPLLVVLKDLRDDPYLMDDVWTTPSTGAIPRWLGDADVCRGVCAMLKRHRCHEELRRLKIEALNLSQFLETELAAIESALHHPNSSYIAS
jgi:hypothetical protein